MNAQHIHEALNQRNIAMEYFYEVGDKILTIAAGELAISISFTAFLESTSPIEQILLKVLWIVLFITVFSSLYSFWGRYKTQLKFSAEIRDSQERVVISKEKPISAVCNYIAIWCFGISNLLLFVLGFLFLNSK